MVAFLATRLYVLAKEIHLTRSAQESLKATSNFD